MERLYAGVGGKGWEMERIPVGGQNVSHIEFEEEERPQVDIDAAVSAVQHVSDAAFAAMNEADIPNVIWAELTCKQSGTVMRTVGEWQELVRQVVWACDKFDEAAKVAADAAPIMQMLRDQLAVKDSIIADLQRQLRERDNERNSVVAVRDTDSGDSLDRGNTRRPDSVGRVDAVTATLTLLPEPDARLGRGNAAMDAGE